MAIMENLLHSVAKMIAVNFAEWLSQNKWKKSINPEKAGFYWLDSADIQYKTIEDLYDVFLENERKRLEKSN